MNAYAERFVGSIKSECLRHIVPMGERHLRAVVREYVEHYHHERNHQGLDKRSHCVLRDDGRGKTFQAQTEPWNGTGMLERQGM